MAHVKTLSFDPDLIVEASMVCDQSCYGCYAPNWISRDIPIDSLRSRPDLFLSPETLRSALAGVQARDAGPISVSIRGGEPTRHPHLPQLIQILHNFATSLFLETHGRWIGRNLVLVNACREFGVVVVIAFDSMHGLAADELQRFCAYLDQESVAWRIMITEDSLAKFAMIRSSCRWCSDDAIISQEKVNTVDRLVRPRLGVVHVDGTITGVLTARASIAS